MHIKALLPFSNKKITLLVTLKDELQSFGLHKKENVHLILTANIHLHTLLGFQNGKMVFIFFNSNIGISPFWKHRFHMEESTRQKVKSVVFNFHRNENYVCKSESYLRETKGCQNSSLLQTWKSFHENGM